MRPKPRATLLCSAGPSGNDGENSRAPHRSRTRLAVDLNQSYWMIAVLQFVARQRVDAAEYIVGRRGGDATVGTRRAAGHSR